MNPVLFLINDPPYYDKEVTEEGKDSENPNTNLDSFVFHEVVTAWEFIDWRLTVNSYDWFLGIAAENEAIQFPVWKLQEIPIHFIALRWYTI